MDAFFTSKFSRCPVEVVFFDVAGTLVNTAEAGGGCVFPGGGATWGFAGGGGC